MSHYVSNFQDRRVFDRDGLLFRLGGAADSVERIVSLSIKSLSDRLPKLAEAVSGGDARGIHFHSHSIGGVAANVSAEDIRSIAARMEELAKAGSLAEMAGLLGALEDAFHSFKSCAGPVKEES